MNDLERFLDLPDVSNIEEEIFVSKRIGKVKIKAMSTEAFSEYQRAAGMNKVSKKGVGGDITKLNIEMVAGQVVEPNFANKEFLDKVKCTTATEFVAKKLLVGEVTEIARQIQRISGFDVDINEEIEEAKN